jgi:hypothetical protein
MTHPQQYPESSLTGSHVTRQEALTAYIQYLLPKVQYQPPLLSINHQQCNRLQSTILMALLPKLHINRHTARSIIHGPEELGGLDLPHIYATQGLGKLRLFLGHLRLQDRTATLIHCDLALLQLLSGMGTCILNLQHGEFSWIESGWLTSLWEFITKIQFKLIYPSQWLPTLSRAGDFHLMEVFSTLNLPHSAMTSLNRCRLYLQVITVSDIASADGTYILPQFRLGQPQDDRTSTLLWPIQGRPTRSEWQLWDQTLDHIEQHQRLITPLGEWLHLPHQTWQYYLHHPTLVVYHILSGFVTRRFPPIVIPNPRTRSQHQPWYDFQHSQPTTEVPDEDLRPATIVHNSTLHGSLFQVNSSMNSFPRPASSPSPPINTPYATLLHLSSKPLPLSEIQEAAEAGQLAVQCGSNFSSLEPLTTATFSFYYANEEVYTHTTDALLSTDRLRAELLSIMLALHVLSQIPSVTIPQPVSVMINNKRAYKYAFSSSPLGVRDAVQAHSDIILEIRRLRQLITLRLSPLHVSCSNAGVDHSTPHSSFTSAA